VKALVRRLIGGELDRELAPILAVNLIGAIAGGMMFNFVGIWGAQRLGASNAELGFGFLGAAVAGALGSAFGGHLSDRYGRRPLVLFGYGIGPLVPLALIAVGTHLWWGIGALVSLGLLGSVGNAASQALVPDLLPPERHEAGYAAVRVVRNLGVTFGPPLGGLLLLGGHWTRFFAGGAVAALVPFLLAVRSIPRRGKYAPEPGGERAPFRAIARDPIFLLFFLSGTFSTLVYFAYETVMPISLVESHGFAPSTWGFLVCVNPALVTLLQLRITARTAHVSAALKLTTAILLMGLPFVALTVTGSLPFVIGVIVVFVLGEMLWIPTSQAVVSRIAPAETRGAYLGAFGGSWAIGFALAPFVGLQVRGAAGDSAMWFMFVALAVVGAVVGFVACTRAFGLHGVAEGPLEEAAATA
jgi:predicted MFS family arabinose efflux permease